MKIYPQKYTLRLLLAVLLLIVALLLTKKASLAPTLPEGQVHEQIARKDKQETYFPLIAQLGKDFAPLNTSFALAAPPFENPGDINLESYVEKNLLQLSQTACEQRVGKFFLD